MFEQILYGLCMVVLTTIIHASFMVLGEKLLLWRMARAGPLHRNLAKAFFVSLLTAWMFLAVVTEALIWAQLYLWHPLITVLPNIESALYFSMVTFTSVGYGDIVLEGKWRILASIQGANGVIIFGWTTALIFSYIQRVYLGAERQ